MAATEIKLPEDTQAYMEDTKTEPATLEWFQEAYHAIAQRAADNGEWLTEQFYACFESEFDDADELYEKTEAMKKDAGLFGLC